MPLLGVDDKIIGSAKHVKQFSQLIITVNLADAMA